MSDNDSDNGLVLVCLRCTDGRPAAMNANVGICAGCGEPVWFDPIMVDIVTKRHDQPPELRCLDCCDGEPVLVPEQLGHLFRSGLNPQDIAYGMALTEVSAGRSPHETYEALIEAFPDEPLAQQFLAALERTMKAVNEAVVLYEHRN